MWQTVGENIASYRTYPRLVGETGGKDFILAHPSADPEALAVAIVRGGYEYQGQKCSAASRVYVPESLWKGGLRDRVLAMIGELRVGDVGDFRNFMGAVIDEKSFEEHRRLRAGGQGRRRRMKIARRRRRSTTRARAGSSSRRWSRARTRSRS